MTKAEIFENLMLPLKSSLTSESWNFLLSRGQMFIDQTSSKNDGKPFVSGSLPLVQQTIKSRIEHFESLVGHKHPANQLKEALSSIQELIPPEMWESYSGNDR